MDVSFHDHDDRIALVTGACGGIGRAVIGGFAAAGMRTFGADIHLDSDAGAECIQCDAASEPDVEALAAAVTDRAGRLDYLVHAAGIAGGGRLAETPLDQWHSVMDANLTSAFLMARTFYPLLAKSNGALVFCGSSNGFNGGSSLSGPAYAAAKAGIHNLTRYLAREWADDKICVNAVAPGPIDTPMVRRLGEDTRLALRDNVPLGREGTAEEVAANILFLCSGQAAWQTGSIINISGGLVV